MKLRRKYFWGLLLASLIPLVIVTLFSHKASKRLGKSISEKTQQVLTDTVRAELISATENYAMITLRSKQSLEFAMRVLVREAETALRGPAKEPGRVYFAEDFADPATAPIDLAASEIHRKILPDGRSESKLISRSEPSIYLPGGVEAETVGHDIALLADLSPTLKQIFDEMEGGVFWVYASLTSGAHISFPGHGGYPKGYDPRLRPWYLMAKNKMEQDWGPPIVDASTRQITFTISAPLTNADGSFAGVAAIDVLLPDVLLKSEISSQWSTTMKSFLVGTEGSEVAGDSRFWVLSQKTNQQRVRNPAAGFEGMEATQENQKEFSELIEYIGDKKSGSLEMSYLGEDSFWAFATIFPNFYFVIIAPKHLVMELPQKVGAVFFWYIRGQYFITIVLVVINILVIAALAFFISRSSTKNVMTMVNGFQKLAKGDFTVRLKPSFNDERDLVATTFNQIMPRLKEHVRMSSELGVAKEVQQSLLPNHNPVLAGFDIAGATLYCEETGGDYYDFISISNDRLAIVVGDVSGHGVSSALLMATARALVMQRSALPGTAAEIMNDVNKHLSMDTWQTNNFMTFFYCELEAAGDYLRWVRAGHDPALIYDPDTDDFFELKGRGMAFGLDYTAEYEEYRQPLKHNQVVVVSTDGSWEMRNEGDEMYGKTKLMETIRTYAGTTAGDILAGITSSLNEFRGEMVQEDDVTLVVIKVTHSC